jgi:hypothetical protein
MDKTLQDWFYVIKNCSVDNTYKMGWSKSIIECCVDNPDQTEISFDSISEKMFKYYWNQTIFFDLQQSPNPNKPPVFISYVKNKIDDYQSEYGKKPIEFERIENKVDLNSNFLNGLLKKDVSHRFLKVSGKLYDLYELDKSEEKIYIKNPLILNEYSDILFEIINYRWSQILETFNSSPRISKKIKITDRGGIRRKPLYKYHNYLSLIDERCFICDKELNGDISIDHLIPWSFMFSDDIWNLVYTHKGCNSSKSNRIVKETEIGRLENRNIDLIEKMDEINLRDKHYEELRYSIEKGLLRKFWISFK